MSQASRGFKKGDTVTTNSNCNSAGKGKEYIVQEDTDNSDPLSIGSNPRDMCHCTENWVLVTKPTIKTMNLVERAKLAFKSEPEKSFIKVGIMDSNENLTDEGKELLLTYLLEQNKTDFKTKVVDPILEEENKE